MLKFIFSLIPVAAAVLLFPRLKMFFVIFFALVSLFTFLSYGADKLFAVMKRRRIPEDLLISFGFFGGAPGAAAGMKIFRHKISKPRFSKALAAAVIIQVFLLIGAAAVGKAFFS